MNHFIFWLLLTAGSVSFGASVQKQVACPHSQKEFCRWLVTARSVVKNRRTSIHFGWEKMVVSRHWKKPLADELVCNVDRNFNPKAGGYVRVWFEKDPDYCDAMKGNPADCGVSFLLDDPKHFHSVQGLVVAAPAGKTLRKVELNNTLDLQCGNFAQSDFIKLPWNTKIGWAKGLPGDGTYVRKALRFEGALTPPQSLLIY